MHWKKVQEFINPNNSNQNPVLGQILEMQEQELKNVQLNMKINMIIMMYMIQITLGPISWQRWYKVVIQIKKKLKDKMQY